jgi:uncharacterized protein (DUF433 family)/DNA-binding transcriptional MerR regulator
VEAREYLGVGLYTVPEAAHLLGVPVAKLRRWAEGYTFAHGRYSGPLFRRDFPELAAQRILTFQDLIELFLVHRFRQAGVSMATIRKAAQSAAEQFNTNHPFAVKRFHTDGFRLFAEVENRQNSRGAGRRIYQELPNRQLVLADVTEFFFKKLDYEGDQVRHYWPLGKQRPVVLDPARSFGQPIDAGSGVPTRVLYGAHQAGDSIEEIAFWFRVEPEAVRAAIEYEQSLAKTA